MVDFTYVPTWSGMAFTAFVTDVFSRRIVTVVKNERVEVPVLVQPRTAGEYAAVLAELAVKVDTGRIYQRELSVVTDAVNGLVEALCRCR